MNIQVISDPEYGAMAQHEWARNCTNDVVTEGKRVLALARAAGIKPTLSVGTLAKTIRYWYQLATNRI